MREQDLFNVVKRYLAPDLRKTSDQYDTIDAVTEQWHAHVEFKCRATHYPDLLLEEKKYNAMMARYKSTGYDPVYVCSTPQGIYSFRLLALPPLTWQTTMNPRTTEFGAQTKIPKRVAYLPVAWATNAYQLPQPGDTTLMPLQVRAAA